MGLQFSSLFTNPHNSQLTYLCSGYFSLIALKKFLINSQVNIFRKSVNQFPCFTQMQLEYLFVAKQHFDISLMQLRLPLPGSSLNEQTAVPLALTLLFLFLQSCRLMLHDTK